MPRLLSRPVTVRSQKGKPFAFTFRGATHVVHLVEEWHEMGEWWRGEGEKAVYRVADDQGGLFELLFDRRTSSWSLEKVYD